MYLVTGGAGFIGSHICERLLKEGKKVRVLDNLLTGKLDNIGMYINNPKFEFIKGSICDMDTCMKACEGVEYVIHEAALTSVPESINNPIEYNKTNVLGTLNMLEASVKNKVKRFIYATSAAVYGESEIIPKVEYKTEGKLLSPYALNKKIDEEYTQLYNDIYGLETIGLRYFNVYGERQDPESAYAGVIPIFISRMIKDYNVTIYGDGNNTRDYIYVSDVVSANLYACHSNIENCGRVYNVGTGKSTTLNELFEIIAKILKYNKKAIHEEARIGDIKHSLASVNDAKELLGYKSKYTLEEAINGTIKWYINNMI